MFWSPIIPASSEAPFNQAPPPFSITIITPSIPTLYSQHWNKFPSLPYQETAETTKGFHVPQVPLQIWSHPLFSLWTAYISSLHFLSPVHSTYYNLASSLTTSLKLVLLRTVDDFCFARHNGLDRLHLTWLFILAYHSLVTDPDFCKSSPVTTSTAPILLTPFILLSFLPHWLLYRSLLLISLSLSTP